jgi:hypothetical protein
MYIVMPSGADLKAIAALFERARFRARPVHERSHLVESILIYELRAEWRWRLPPPPGRYRKRSPVSSAGRQAATRVPQIAFLDAMLYPAEAGKRVLRCL